MENQFTAAAFNVFIAEHKLMASRCKGCGGIYLPPRPLCPETYSTDMEWMELSGKGSLVSFTAISVGSAFMMQSGFDRNNPYVTGVVEVEEGARISALILGVDAKNPETIKVSAPVQVEFVELGPEGAKKTVLAFRVQ
jgi:uncharacterized OB-fold protein